MQVWDSLMGQATVQVQNSQCHAVFTWKYCGLKAGFKSSHLIRWVYMIARPKTHLVSIGTCSSPKPKKKKNSYCVSYAVCVLNIRTSLYWQLGDDISKYLSQKSQSQGPVYILRRFLLQVMSRTAWIRYLLYNNYLYYVGQNKKF